MSSSCQGLCPYQLPAQAHFVWMGTRAPDSCVGMNALLNSASFSTALAAADASLRASSRPQVCGVSNCGGECGESGPVTSRCHGPGLCTCTWAGHAGKQSFPPVHVVTHNRLKLACHASLFVMCPLRNDSSATALSTCTWLGKEVACAGPKPACTGQCYTVSSCIPAGICLL